MTIATPPSLLNIPTELKYVIAAYIPTSDVLNLIATRQTLGSAFFPTLCRRISINWSKDKSNHVNTLLQLTSQNPACYQYIKHLNLRATSDEKPTLHPSDAAVVDALKNIQRSAPQPAAATPGIPHLSTNNKTPNGTYPAPSAPLPLLLTLCTHLTHLHISLPLSSATAPGTPPTSSATSTPQTYSSTSSTSRTSPSRPKKRQTEHRSGTKRGGHGSSTRGTSPISLPPRWNCRA